MDRVWILIIVTIKMIGKVFQDQYKVVKAIGRGEFSEVYLGQDLKTKEKSS